MDVEFREAKEGSWEGFGTPVHAQVQRSRQHSSAIVVDVGREPCEIHFGFLLRLELAVFDGSLDGAA